MTTAQDGWWERKKKPRNHKKAPFHRIMSAATTRTPQIHSSAAPTGTYTSAKKNAYDSTDIAHSVSKCIFITCSVDGAYPSGQKCEIMSGKLGLAATCLYDMYLQLFFFKALVLIARQFLHTTSI